MLPEQIISKRTKIVATIGPASWSEDAIRQMIQGGMNVARVNFSHGDNAQHSRIIDTIRKVAAEEDTAIGIICDMQGPKIRIGKVANEPLALSPGDKITLTLDDVPGDNNVISLPHPEFVCDIVAGMRLLLDDGNIEFTVKAVDNGSLMCEVVIGGELRSMKGVSAPEANLTLEAITEKDKVDIAFALEKKTDYIAMSFVRTPQDIAQLRELIAQHEGEAAIIAKIEKHEALDNINEIIAVSDAVMVARGDLGLETPAEEVPFHQKEIIRLCNAASKPVITATQMLSSMEHAPRPTRAEASDVYNAIIDGSDAVMLSNETAIGAYPIKAVETMRAIAIRAEKSIWNNPRNPSQFQFEADGEGDDAIANAVSEATYHIARVLDLRAIITSTKTGYTARRVARERPHAPIICVTPWESTYQRMTLVWGVIPLHIPEFASVEEMFRVAIGTALERHLVKQDDMLVIIAGMPFREGGKTNMLKVHRVGEANELV